MATIAKFYLLDATTPNTGTMPGAGTAFAAGQAADGEAAGARTARDATSTPGTSNPDIESLVTAAANTLAQAWGHRRFVSRPLAARTFTDTDGNWTLSWARSLSNTNHNNKINAYVYGWRPSSGLRVGTGFLYGIGTVPGTTGQLAESFTVAWGSSSPLTILDGDILVFEISSTFPQLMAVAYTDSFAYNGTTEASTTTCASFLAPPAPLTLFGGAATAIPDLGLALAVT